MSKLVPTWAHPEWEDWQLSKGGGIWHAAALFHVDKNWRITNNYARERRAFCGVRTHGACSSNPEPDEPGLRCGTCLAALGAQK